MSTRFIRLFCLIITMAMLFSFISCARTEEDPTDTTTTEEVEVSPFEEFFEISYLIDHNHRYEDGRWDQLELEEKFNIKLIVPGVEWNQSGLTEHLFAMLAAGEVPDMAWYPPVNRFDAYDQGLHRSVNMDMVKEHMPSYYAILQDFPGSFDINRVPDTDNEYYGLSMASALATWCYFNHGIRLDWLENLGYSFDDLVEFVPDMRYDDYGDFSGRIYFSNHVFSYADFLELNRAFTEDDPNMDGEDNTYFNIDLGFHMHSWLTLATFGIASTSHVHLYHDRITGDMVPVYAYEGYRDFLVWRQDALEKGHIRKLPGEHAWLEEKKEVAARGVHGYYELDKQLVFGANVETSMEVNPPGTLFMYQPEAKLLVFPGFIGPMGIGGNSRYRMHPVIGTSWTFGIDVSDEKLVRILQFMEYTHFDSQETYIRYTLLFFV